MSLLLPIRFASSLDFPSRRLDFTAYATAPLTLLIAITAVWLRVQLMLWLCSAHPSQDGSRRSPADFTTAAKYLFELIRRTLLPRMGYREATTHIQLWLLGALVSHSEFDIVDFLICEIEDTILDGIRARRQLPYAHYLCHIFA
jgi:hypothetical protein